MAVLKAVKVIDPGTGAEVEELHPIEICDECSRVIDNALEGFFGHAKVPVLVLCQECYQKKAFSASWEADRVKVKGKWLGPS